MGTMSCFARMFASCCPGKEDTSSDEIPYSPMPPESAPSIDWDLAKTRGLGQTCEICGDDKHVATHAAPCSHAACAECWRQWKLPRCMICSATINASDVVRAPFDVVPLVHDDETPMMGLENAIENSMTELVSLKQSLRAVRQSLDTTAENTQGAEGDSELRLMVAQIGAVAVWEQIQTLIDQLGSPPVDSSHGWATCEASLTAACMEVEAVSPRAGKACTLLRPHKKIAQGPWMGQWHAIAALADDILHRALPHAMAAVGGAFRGEQALEIGMAVSMVEAQVEEASVRVEEAVQRIEDATQYLLSMAVSPS